ncbi:hypothetical protein MUP77_20695 [Candidatus Bathyarchaeota archaeon]|nr:hypothetical protein [Candidatus Bathyarchaeota archaeon]
MTANKALAPLQESEGNQFNRMTILEENMVGTMQKGNGQNRKMKQKPFEVDISKLEGEGDFPCPKCGTLISPDDESDETYTILETKGDEELLEEVVIQCKKCQSKIQLKGFDELEEAEVESSFKISEPQDGAKPKFHSIHSLSLEGKVIGRVAIEYLQEEDVKAFGKINRNLKVGDAFKARIFIDSSSGVTVESLGSKGLAEIVETLKKRGKGIRERDIFVVAVENGKEKLVGRAESLVQETSN